MRAISFFTTVLLLAVNLACMEKQPPRAAVPIVPQPARAPAPPAPVIADQTVVQLPAPQAVPPGSVPARPAVEYHAPEEPAPVVVAPAPVRRATRPSAPAGPKETQPKENTPPAQASGAEATGAQPPAGTQPPPEETPAAPAQPLRSAEDLATSSGQVNAILDEVKKILAQVEGQPKSAISSTTTTSINRINSLVKLAEQASASNDLRQAESLAKRAVALARDLNRP
jgi:hypothetical protein